MRFSKFAILLANLTILTASTCPSALRADETTEADEALVKQHHVSTDGAGLLTFLHSRTLTEADLKELEKLIQQLGSDSFAAREQASVKLSARGSPALPFLRTALQDPDREVRRRAEFCIEEIERGPGPALPAAAIRLLALRKPAGAVEVLLNYLPFNDDEIVEDESLACLTALGKREGNVDPKLTAALKDPLPVRRLAGAYVLGRIGDNDQRAAVRLLLEDAVPKVRLRAAQGLVAGKEKEAVPTLVSLLVDAPITVSWHAEDLLNRIAGEQAPVVSVGEGDAASRKKSREAWTAWWREHGPKVDLAKLEESQRPLGLTIIAELDSNKVWECGLDGKPRWKLDNLAGPMDAHVLPGGRVLIAENHGQRITERDLKGNVLWEKRVNQNPIACQRLANGNTFIATYNTVMEVSRDGKEIYSHTPGPGFFIFGAQKLRNGHIVCISAQGEVTEMNAAGKELKKVQVANNGGWCGVEALPGGRYLVAMMNNSKVMEVDGTGKAVWECQVAGACAATRLPNGNTLVASMGNRRVMEVDRTGKKVWEQATAGRPFRVHRR